MSGVQSNSTSATVVFEDEHTKPRLTFSTEHAHDVPRGEVYVEVISTEGEGRFEVDLQRSMTPDEVLALADDLTALALYAKTKPIATLDPFAKFRGE